MIVADVSLRAPIAVPVTIRSHAQRVFRLAWNVGEDGVRLERRLPFEMGRPVEVQLRLPGGEALVLRACVAGGGPDDEDADAAGGVLVYWLDYVLLAFEKTRPERLGLRGAICSPTISRLPSVLTATAIIAATETMRPPSRCFR